MSFGGPLAGKTIKFLVIIITTLCVVCVLTPGPLRAPSSSSLSSKSQWTVEVTGNRINEGVTKGSSSVRGIMGGVLGLDYSSSEEEDKT